MTKKYKTRRKIIFSPYAWGVITAYFGWGVEGVWNRNEQICALGGRIDHNTIQVETTLPMLGAEASPGHIKINAETWLSAIWTLKDMGMELTGSIHSHPNLLSVFFSADDRLTHMRMFPNGASAILNPQRCEIKAFDQTRKPISVNLIDQEGKHYEIHKIPMDYRPDVDIDSRVRCGSRVENAHPYQNVMPAGHKYGGGRNPH